jgi:hypothetical protein
MLQKKKKKKKEKRKKKRKKERNLRDNACFCTIMTFK